MDTTLFIPAETIREASSNCWTPPEEGASIRGEVGEKSYRAQWYETIVVKDMSRSVTDEGVDSFTVEVEVPIDSTNRENVGRRWWCKFWINPQAMKDRGHEFHDNTMRAIKELSAFLKASGKVDTSQGYDPKMLFDEKVALGVRLKCRVTVYTKNTLEPGQSLDRWTSED